MVRTLLFLLFTVKFGFSTFLHAPAEFQGLIPTDLEELNQDFNEKEECLLQEAILLLGEGQGKATKYLKAHDVRLAKLSSSAFQNVEKKLEKMSPEATKFIAQLMEYLGTKPGNLKPDKNGNPQVPKEVHEFSIVGSWDKLDSKTKDELQDVFPSIAKTVKSDAFKEHAQSQMTKHGWIINK